MTAIMDRRRFLKIAGIGALAIGAGHCYLNDENMKKAPEKEGKILADMHSHLAKKSTLEGIAETLSWGITGLTTWYGNSTIISYNDAVQLPGVREIDLGLFAEIEVRGSRGYFAKTQEVEADFHILAVGCIRDLPNFDDSRKAVEAIHKYGGIAILNHPCTVATGGNRLIKYRVAEEKEIDKIKEICTMVDEVEVFNAQNINAVPFAAWMKQSNRKAKEIAAEFGFKGVASSDAHRALSQSKVAGIYIPNENLCMDAIKRHIKAGNFERHEQYVSRWSFVDGMFLSK